MEEEHIDTLEEALTNDDDEDEDDNHGGGGNQKNNGEETNKSTTMTGSTDNDDNSTTGNIKRIIPGGSKLMENLEEDLGEAIGRCGRAGTLALIQMQRVVFDDLETQINLLFSGKIDCYYFFFTISNKISFDILQKNISLSQDKTNILNGVNMKEKNDVTKEALDTMLYTLEDYFIDFQTRIHPRPLLRLMCICFSQLICIYVSSFLFLNSLLSISTSLYCPLPHTNFIECLSHNT